MKQLIKTIHIDNQDIIDLLESLQFEVESRKEVIGFLISSNGINSESFRKYEKEYQEFYIKYQTAKDEFEETYVRPNISEEDGYVSWDLDFQLKEVKIYI